MKLIYLIFIIIVGLFYSWIREFYIRVYYYINKVENDPKQALHITGDYADINYDNKNIRIVRECECWFYEIEGERKAIEIGIPFPNENEKFIITKKEKKGGFLVLFSLIIIAVTIFIPLNSLYYNVDRKKKNDGKSVVTEHVVENTAKDTQDDIMESSKEENQHDVENTKEKQQTAEQKNSLIINIDGDIKSVVEEYDCLFRNEIIVDWSSCMNTDSMRPNLKGKKCEIGLNATQYQAEIDWSLVKKDGIDFALIHIGSRGMETGKLRWDSSFRENIENAISNGIKVGTTFYSQAINKEEMDEEIDMMLEGIKGYNIDYPIGIALQRSNNQRTGILTDEEYINIIKYFCIRIKKEGYTPMILGKSEWYDEFPKNTFNGYLKLVASEGSVPSGIDNCIIWGYTEKSKGEVDGINTDKTVLLYLSGYVN